MMYLITGGERSGKSGFAEKIAKEKSDQPMYVATARQWMPILKTASTDTKKTVTNVGKISKKKNS